VFFIEKYERLLLSRLAGFLLVPAKQAAQHLKGFAPDVCFGGRNSHLPLTRREADMKITDVKTTVLFAPFTEMVSDAARKIAGRDVLLVEVFTDQGVNGLGFLTGLGVGHGSEIFIINEIILKSLRPGLLGQDPTRLERLWQMMYLNTARFGRKGAAVRAISGVDMALWDIVGVMAGLPLYKLLGGCQDRVRVYASGGFYSRKNEVDALVDELQSYVARGFKGVKMKVGKDLRLDVKRVEAARKALGDEIDIMLDANEAWDSDTALRFMHMVAPCNIYWLEEPVPADDVEGLKRLNSLGIIPIAAGESEYTVYGFRDLIASRAVDVAQPDVTRVGGISEWMRVAHVAKAWNMPCVPHAIQEVHVSLAAAVSNAPMMEFFPHDQYLQTFLSQLFVGLDGLGKLVDSCVTPPETPGLGLVPDGDLVKRDKVA
jgi:D-arabinonate dehydratase